MTALSLWDQLRCPGLPALPKAETHPPHREQLVPGNHLLLPLFCCQVPPKTWATSVPTCPTLGFCQQLSQSCKTFTPDTARQPQSFAPCVTTKQQRRSVLSFLFSTLRWDTPAAASRPQHLCSNPPAGCPCCPLAGHTQSLGGTVPLPVHARLQPPPLLGGARRNPRLGQGAKALLAKVHPRWHRQMPREPRSPQGCDPKVQTQAPAASLPGSLFPHRGYIFITVAKGDQLHPHNTSLHKTNRPGNWDRPVKYFIVWTRGVRAAAHKLSQPYIPGITALFLPLILTFSLRAAWGRAWCPHACFRLSPTTQSLTRLQQHKALRSIQKNQCFLFPGHHDTVLLWFQEIWHHRDVSRVGGLDPAPGQGRGQGFPLSMLCHLLNLQLKARGAESPSDTVMAKPTQLCRRSFPLHW